MASRVRFMLATALLSGGASCVKVAAQMDMSITPGVVDVVCELGKSAPFAFTMASNMPEPMQCSVAAGPMDVDANGVPSQSNERGLPDASPYVKFSPVGFNIPRGKFSIVVTATVTMPRGATGGRYALVTFSAVPKGAQRRDTSAGFAIAPEIRAVLMVTAKGTATTSAPRPVAVNLTSGREGQGKPGAAWRAEVTVRNTANCHIALDGKIAITSIGRRLIGSSVLQGGSGLVFPQRERVFNAVGRKPLPDGGYEATVSVAPRGSLRYGSLAVFFTVTNGKVEISGTQKPASSG